MRVVAVLLHSAVRVFDYGVIHEVFGVDRADDGVPEFTVWRCAPGRVSVAGGVSLHPTHRLSALSRADLVLVPGAEPAPSTATPAERDALRRAHAAGVPIASLCSTAGGRIASTRRTCGRSSRWGRFASFARTICSP